MRNRESRRGIATAIGAIVLVVILIGVASYVAYSQVLDAIRADRFSELRVVGSLKADEIEDWRAERVADVRVGATWASDGQDIGEWLAAPEDARRRADLLSYLAMLQARDPAVAQARYEEVILATPEGDFLLSPDPDVRDLDAGARSLVAQVVASRTAELGELVRDEPSGDVHIDAAAPVVDPSGRPLAVLILRSDPGTYLFPYLQSWPTQGDTAETLLVRRDGDSALFLNTLRYRTDPALTIRVPLSATQVPAVTAVLGNLGDFAGTDYRGTAVLADIRPIGNSPWFLVTKVDASEALAEGTLLGVTILVIGLLAALLFGGAVALVLALRQAGLQSRLVRVERDRTSVAHRHERVLALARDPFMLLDPSGRLVDANPAAVAAYGYRREELLRLSVLDLRAPEARAALETDWRAVEESGGALFETVHRRKDGSTFPVEVSMQAIEIDGATHHQAFVRDITARKADEARLRRLGAAYATLAETNEAIVHIREEAALYAAVCRIAVEHGGYLGAWVGVVEGPAERIVPAASAGSLDDYIHQLHVSTDPARAEGSGPAARAAREERAVYVDDFLHDPIAAPSRTLAAEAGIRASAALPLRRGGAPCGVFSIYSREPNVFDDQMRALLEEMAADISFALDGIDLEAARRRTEEALRVSQATLTVQLDELRRWNEAMLGREERVVELKGEVNDLLAKAGEAARYPAAARDGASADA